MADSTTTNSKKDELSVAEKLIARRERELDERQSAINNHEKQLEALEDELRDKLAKATNIGNDEAKKQLLELWENKLREDVAKRIKAAEEEIKIAADDRAKELLADAMRHGATDYVPEFTLSTVQLQSDEHKGRIIGKDGRNIRAFELATGIDVDLEEEGVIKLSSFDSVRREIARVSLLQLLRDGRIQPERIEEVVKKNREEIEKTMIKAGEDLAHRVGVYNLPEAVIKQLGRFKYRFSYGQNLILHTLEETKIGVALAQEIGADADVVRLGCLLHDIGKVVTEKEGSHVDLGVEFAKKHGFPESVVGCIAAHHEDIPFPSVEAVLVYIADAISGGRPGARHEDFQEYLKRIKTIEDTARTKRGVKDVYALQAGRELRVIVKPQEITDDEAIILAQKIREELESKFEVFPGQIKVTVIREFRAEDTAKFS